MDHAQGEGRMKRDWSTIVAIASVVAIIVACVLSIYWTT